MPTWTPILAFSRSASDVAFDAVEPFERDDRLRRLKYGVGEVDALRRAAA